MTGAARPQRHCTCKPFTLKRTKDGLNVSALPRVHRLGLNRLDWPSRRPCEPDTVVELGRRVDDFPVSARDFHTDTSAVDLDVDGLALQRFALDDLKTH